LIGVAVEVFFVDINDDGCGLEEGKNHQQNDEQLGKGTQGGSLDCGCPAMMSIRFSSSF
jgi:hypothetical protein